MEKLHEEINYMMENVMTVPYILEKHMVINLLEEQEEGGESEFEEGIYGADSDEASADSLSLRLVEGAAADAASEAIVLNDRERDSSKHAGDDVRAKKYRRIGLMTRTLILGYKKGDYQEFRFGTS